MPWLNNPGMDGADWHLENAFTFDLSEFVAFTRERRQHGTQVKVLAQGIDLRPIIVKSASAWIRVADQFQTKEVLDFALLPVGRVDCIRQRRELWLVWRDRHAKDGKAVSCIECENIV